jgi:hypothetical protein
MRSIKPMPLLAELQATYVIDRSSPSGLNRFKASKGRNGRVGPVVSVGTDGYYRMQFNKQFYRTHRVIYYLHHGIDPLENVVDHIDGDIKNNRAENLRACTQQENLQNAKKRQKGELPKGISKLPNGMYKIQVSVQNEVHICELASLWAAMKYIDQLRKRHHGEFARN